MALILIVDDEPAMRIMLSLPLRKRGHQVREAASVAVAQAQALPGSTPGITRASHAARRAVRPSRLMQ